MKHILYLLQQSIYSNEGKWLSADSNINMMCGILRELVEKTDWHFHVLISPIETFYDIKDYKELIDNPRVHFIPYKFPINAFLNRYNFDMAAFDRVFHQIVGALVSPEDLIVWNNITELSRNIKTYLFYKSPKTKLITCCYWLDMPFMDMPKVDVSISYFWRQFDGFQCSDLAVFTCESCRKAYMEHSRMVFPEPHVRRIEEKSVIWDFGFSSKEMDLYRVYDKFDKKTILFLNRMSDINYTKHKEFITAANKLAEMRDDFQVVFTNPSMKVSWDWLKENVQNLKIIKEGVLNREEYVKLLWMADVSVHLYTAELMGGCSEREASYCHNKIVAPKVYEYRRILGEKYPFYVQNDLSDLVEVLNKALDKSFTDARIIERNTDSSFEVVSSRVIDDINHLTKEMSW